MLKYFGMLVVAAATLVIVDAAQARGRRHGCHGGSCYVGGDGGCAGGACYVGGDHKMAGPVDAAAPVVGVAPSSSDIVVSAPPAPRYSTNVRRGWFARRR